MNIKSRMLLMILTVCLLLSACGAVPANEETAVPTEAATEPATEPAAEPQETEPVLENLHYTPTLSETVMPTEDAATGTLIFYINGQQIHAGAPVSDLLELDYFTYDDLDTIVQPWHMSELIRLDVQVQKTEEDKDGNKTDVTEEQFIFFVAMNTSNEPCAISECMIYSLTINCEKGIEFGSGNENEHFVSGITTRDEIVAAYGEPHESNVDTSTYEEIAYYSPFSYVSFTFKKGVVRQINTCYSANVYGSVAEELNTDLDVSYYGADSWILMSQYLDITPYLPEKEEEEAKTDTSKTASEEATEPEEENKVGIVADLDDFIYLDGKKIELGCNTVEMPDPFGSPFKGLSMPLNRNYYIRTGIGNEEEFFIINAKGGANGYADGLQVKGVITENRSYDNWGIDNSGFHTFEYQGMSQDSTIDDVLELFGQPREVLCTSSGRFCFAWLHYETEEGDYLHVRVDPMLNEVVEVRVSKYFENEKYYD